MSNTDDIKFSILIPSYKKIFFHEALASVINQTYLNWEIIVIDDCSPEDLKSVVDSIGDKRILYIRNKENIGARNVVDNWNKCLSYASGEYVLCMGDDDKLTSDCLNNCRNYIAKNTNISVFHLQTLLINEESEIVDVQEGRPAWESVYSATFNKLKGRLQYIGDWLFKTDSLKKCGGFYNLPYAWYSDDITPIIVGRDYGIINIPEFGFQYRVSSHTISSDEKNIEGKIDACRKAHKWYRDFFSIPANNSADTEYQRCILKMLPGKEKTAIIKTLATGMKIGKFRAVLRFFVEKRRLNINTKMILFSLILSMKSMVRGEMEK